MRQNLELQTFSDKVPALRVIVREYGPVFFFQNNLNYNVTKLI